MYLLILYSCCCFTPRQLQLLLIAFYRARLLKMEVKERVKRFFKRHSRSPGRSPKGSSLSTANPSFTSLQSNSSRLDPPLQSSTSPLQIRASSSSVRSHASVNNSTVSQTSELPSNSGFSLPSLTSRPSTSPGPSQLSKSPTTPAIKISPSTPAIEISPAASAIEEITSTPAPSPNLWEEVFKGVNGKTKKWIDDHGLNSTQQASPEGQIKELLGLIKSMPPFEEKNAPWKIEIGNQKIILREYIADAVAFLTMAGDIAISFAPPQASAPWAAAKAVLKVDHQIIIFISLIDILDILDILVL